MDAPIKLPIYLGAAIRAARSNVGISQQELANRAGVTRRFIQELENGRSDISLSKLRALAIAMDTSLSDIVTRIDSEMSQAWIAPQPRPEQVIKP